MGRQSAVKQKRGEREVAGLFRDAGFAARRGRQYRGGPDSPDVIVDDLPWIHVEVKRKARLEILRDVYGAVDQARGDMAPGQIPVAFIRRDHCGWLAVLEAGGFMELAREYESSQCEEVDD